VAAERRQLRAAARLVAAAVVQPMRRALAVAALLLIGVAVGIAVTTYGTARVCTTTYQTDPTGRQSLPVEERCHREWRW
jgi:predicted DNA repair protein MutK